MLANAWRWFLAVVLALLALGLAASAPPVGAQAVCVPGLSGDCAPVSKCEAPTGCDPDPTWTYTAPEGYVTCRLGVKASVDVWTFTQDGCMGNAENPLGYCVSGLGTRQITVTRTCGDLPHCHAISHIEPWIDAAPTAVTLGAVDVTPPPEWSPVQLLDVLAVGLLGAALLALARQWRHDRMVTHAH